MSLLQQWIIDGIEGEFVRVETADAQIVVIPRNLFPSDVKEGDLLRLSITAESSYSRIEFLVDHEATQARLEEMQKLRDSLRAGPSGDLKL